MEIPEPIEIGGWRDPLEVFVEQAERVIRAGADVGAIYRSALPPSAERQLEDLKTPPQYDSPEFQRQGADAATEISAGAALRAIFAGGGVLTLLALAGAVFLIVRK